MRRDDDPGGVACNRLRPGMYMSWRRHRYLILRQDDDENALAIHVEDIDTDPPERTTFALSEIIGATDADAAPIFATSEKALCVEIARRYPAPQFAVATDDMAHLLKRADTIITIVEAVDEKLREERRKARLRGVRFRKVQALDERILPGLGLEDHVSRSLYYKNNGIYDAHGGVRENIAGSLRRVDYQQPGLTAAQIHLVDALIVKFLARRDMEIRVKGLRRLMTSTLTRTGHRWPDPDQFGARVPTDLVDALLNPKIPMADILSNGETARRMVENVTAPSGEWLRQHLDHYAHDPELGRAYVTSRHGEEMWEREHMVYNTFVTNAQYSNHLVFGDHMLLKVWIVDDETRLKRLMVWFSALLDAYSRSVLGFGLHFGGPCIEAILNPLRHAIWEKTSHITLGVEGSYPCLGMMSSLSLDNALAHYSNSVRETIRGLSCGGRYGTIDVDFRKPYMARQGALIERWLGNISAQIREEVVGAIRDGSPKGKRDAEKQACLLYADINRIVHQIVVRYQDTPHSELHGMTPNQKWLEGVRGGIPIPPPQTPEMERFFWRRGPGTRFIRGGSKGVSVFGMDYWSEDLQDAEKVDQNGKPVPYGYAFETTDISRIALFKDTEPVCAVRPKQLLQADGTYLPVSLWEREMARQLSKADEGDGTNWLEYYTERIELHDIRRTEQLKAERAERKRQRGVAERGDAAAADTQGAEEAVRALAATEVGDHYTKLFTRGVGTEAGS